jgi:circadian clock protein KaiC
MDLTARVSTGVDGLDSVLKGGLHSGHVYLVEGGPGTGKTTLALQFLMAGVRGEHGGPGLYFTLSQSREELEGIAASHEFDMTDIEIVELLASEAGGLSRTQTVIPTAEEELAQLIEKIGAQVETRRPRRVVVDSLAELRLISTSMLRFRRAILGLKTRLANARTTALLVEAFDGLGTAESSELTTHGTIRLDWTTPEFGMMRRRLQIIKMRGSPFFEGYHDLNIETGGVVVYPRLVPPSEPREVEGWEVRTGDDTLDELLGGGLPGNGTTLLSGDTGTGKSILSAKLVDATARRGIKAGFFLFEELPEDVLDRAESIGMNLRGHIDGGLLHLEHFDPTETTQGQLFRLIEEVVEGGARLVVIDSLTGFVRTLRAGGALLPQFNALLNSLKRLGVATVMTLNEAEERQAGQSEIDFSYLTDNVIRLSHYRQKGEIGRSIWVGKKRFGPHSREVRALHIEPPGVTVRPIEDRPA